MNVQKVGVIGAGQMGNGIAQVLAASGFDVILTDVKNEALEKARATISGSCDRLIKKQTMTEEAKKQILARIQTTTDFSSLKQAEDRIFGSDNKITSDRELAAAA